MNDAAIDAICDLPPEFAMFPEINPRSKVMAEVGDGDAVRQNHSAVNEDSGALKQGRPIVKIEEAEWRSLVAKEEKLTLIGRFSQVRPPIEEIRAQFQRILPIAGKAHIGVLNRKQILIKFTDEGDCNRILAQRQTRVGESFVRFERWSPERRAKKDEPKAAVWILLPQLPYHLFEAKMIERICGPIGKFLMLDGTTLRRSRPSVARAKLEIDLLENRIDKLWIEFSTERGFWQSVEYEAIPDFCTNCSRLGHGTAVCRRGRRIEGGNPVGELSQRLEETEDCGKAKDDGALVGRESEGDGGVPVEDGAATLQMSQRNGEERTVTLEASGLLDGPGLAVDPEELGRDLGLDYSPTSSKSSSKSLGFEEWVEKLKSKFDFDKELVMVVDMAKQEVLSFFEETLNEFGREAYDRRTEELVEKANAIFLRKMGEFVGPIKVGGLHRDGPEINSEMETGGLQRDGQDMDGPSEACLAQMVKKKFEEAAMNLTSEIQGDQGSSSGPSKETRILKRVDAAEGCREWAKKLKESMESDAELNQMVEEALQEINTYLLSVYDEAQQKYIEDEGTMDKRASVILMEKAGEKLGLSTRLGRELKANAGILGGLLCDWAENWAEGAE